MFPIKRRPVPSRTSDHLDLTASPIADEQSATTHHDTTFHQDQNQAADRHQDHQRLGDSVLEQVNLYRKDSEDIAYPRRPHEYGPISSYEQHAISSPSPTSPVQVPPAQESRQHVLRYWTWELLALFLAIGLMVAKVVILSYFEGQELPDWPLSITLNALIALLSTIQRAALLLVLAEIIGQSRWLWYTERTRPLHHLDAFDEARRSSLGALRLQLLAFINRAHFSTKCFFFLASWITISSFAIGPFTQQALGTAPCRRLVASDNSSVPTAHHVPGPNKFFRFGAASYEIDVDMKSTMIHGITHLNGQDTTVRPECSSGDCTFQDYGTGVSYSTMGMCYQCIETTSLVREADDDDNDDDDSLWRVPVSANVSLTDRVVVVMADGMPWFTVANPSGHNFTFAKSLFTEEFAAASPNAIFNTSILSFTTAACPEQRGTSKQCPYVFKKDSQGRGYLDTDLYAGVVAASCTIYPCLKSYNGSVEGGILKERVISERPVSRRPPDLPPGSMPITDFYHNYTALQSPCLIDNGTWYTAENVTDVPAAQDRVFADLTLDGDNITAPEECIYRLEGEYATGLARFLSSRFNGSCYWQSRNGANMMCPDLFLSALHKNHTVTMDSISAQFDGLTTAMTNEFRRTGLGALSSREGGDRLAAETLGLVYETSVCTTLDWRWLLLPIILVASTAVLMIWMVLHNRFWDKAQPVWKGSVLPLMLYGLVKGVDHDEKEVAGDAQGRQRVESMSRIEQISKRTTVRFENGSKGVKPGFYSE